MRLTSDLKRQGWGNGVLGQYIALSNGRGITANQRGHDKPFPVYGSSRILHYAGQSLICSDSIVVGRVEACGFVQIAKAPCWMSDNAMYASNMFLSAEKLFGPVLQSTFIGELTAEREATNADWVAQQQAHHERLPRLLVLGLLREKATRAKQAAAAVLVIALMKYVFLLQMEGNGSRRRLYHFVPYQYGPFAKKLYGDLEALQSEGVVCVENDSEEDETTVTLADLAKADTTLAEQPEDFKEDAATIIEIYGDLDHNAVLNSVYKKYSAYARKSRLRRGRRVSQ